MLYEFIDRTHRFLCGSLCYISDLVQVPVSVELLLSVWHEVVKEGYRVDIAVMEN
jgi:hypothetical protein